ncbi:MAG: hypothetical protein HXX08_22315 [Chloroflexi bacterium]|uniref:Uncharacterized protein n=1 Tax=Candidatus Chlorohelix allophototropha TaxID=3003348 RepID=A0A8T7M9C4_9CHLR|nr:hypothetical protein [Chloroflexota bacterium]WJW68533.1 hypothetical protein OZ401_004147 [Chloroflexota bacterium L227-S17]
MNTPGIDCVPLRPTLWDTCQTIEAKTGRIGMRPYPNLAPPPPHLRHPTPGVSSHAPTRFGFVGAIRTLYGAQANRPSLFA